LECRKKLTKLADAHGLSDGYGLRKGNLCRKREFRLKQIDIILEGCDGLSADRYAPSFGLVSERYDSGLRDARPATLEEDHRCY
jgi:hypothetical protein